jgi:tRNA-dihydrouridine synthase
MSLNICLAPLQGFTDFTYRNIYARFFSGCDRAMAPYVTTRPGKALSAYKLKDLVPENNRNLPLVPQLLSKEPEEFVGLARALFDLGYAEINWNLGCPFPTAVGKKRGAGLLPHPDSIRQLLDAVCGKIPNRLSIKTRLGLARPDEILALVPLFNNYPLTELIIHPRLGVQKYAGTTDLETFGQCVNLSCHPVVYNGDIRTLRDFKTLSARFPTLDRWMLGRGVLADPLLPERIKGAPQLPRADERRRLKEFHDALFAAYCRRLAGPAHVLDRMKGLWGYLAGSMENGARFIKDVRKMKKLEPYQSLVSELFGD